MIVEKYGMIDKAYEDSTELAGTRSKHGIIDREQYKKQQLGYLSTRGVSG